MIKIYSETHLHILTIFTKHYVHIWSKLKLICIIGHYLLNFHNDMIFFFTFTTGVFHSELKGEWHIRIRSCLIWILAWYFSRRCSSEIFFPQNDLLGHNNIRAFVTHCGFIGVVETLYQGVPIIFLFFF